MRNLPPRLRQPFIDACIPAFQAYAAATNNSAKLAALRKILAIPRVCLPQVFCADLHARARHNLRARRLLEACARVLSQPFDPLSASQARNAVTDELVPVPHDPEVDRNDEPPQRDGDFATTRRCFSAKAHVREDHITRAFNALNTGTAAPATEETLQQLQQQHPPASEPIPSPPQESPRVAVDATAAYRVIKQSVANGSAPGLSGWTGELLLIAASNGACMEGIVALITDLLHGSLPDEAHALIAAGRLIALLKPNGTVRPIAISEPFLKLAQQYGMKTVNPNLIFADTPQYGAGVPNGVETAVHDIFGALTAGGPDAVMIACDWSNAFNNRKRAAIAAALYRNPHLASLHRLFHWLYRQSATMLYFDRDGTRVGDCTSAEGVRQGDPLSPLAYALSTLHIVQRLAQRRGITIRAVADDVSFVQRTWRDAIDTFRELMELGRTDQGLNLNIDKCVLVWPHSSTPPDELQRVCKQIGLRIDRKAKLLGGVVTFDTRARADFVREFVDLAIKQLQPLRHAAMPAQYAVRMLSNNALPKMQFLMRVTPPSRGVTAQFERYDAEVLSILAAKLGLTTRQLRGRMSQIRQSTKNGGLAIASAADLHSCAYLSSYLLHLRGKPERRPQNCVFNGVPVFDGGLYALRASHYVRCNSHGLTSDVLPPNPDALFAKYRAIGQPARGSKHVFGRKLQHTLVAATERRRFADMVKLSDQRDGGSKRRVRWAALLMQRTGRWLTAPLTENNQLGDDEFALAVRLRLGLPLTNNMPDRCPMCGEDCATESCYDHLMYCPNVEAAYIERHDDVVQTLQRIASAYAHAKAEPAADRRADRAVRPDLRIRHPHGTYLTDVRIVHPCAPSYVDKYKKPESLLAATARLKAKKLKEYADLQGGDMHPFIVSTFGSMDKGCATYFDLIRKFAANAHPSDPMSGPIAVGAARATVAVAIQRAVARATLDALFIARTVGDGRHGAGPPLLGPHPRAAANMWLNANFGQPSGC